MKYRIHCAEIWGGLDAIESDVCMPGLDATIFSQGAEGEGGGDIYFLSVCSFDILTRIAIADVRGHGRNVKELSAWLYALLAEQMNSLDGAAISTAAVLRFNSMDNTLHFAYAGHPPVLVRRAQSLWSPVLLSDTPGPAILPLGVMRRVQYDQGTIALAPGDKGLSAVLATTDHAELPQVRQAVLRRMREFAGPQAL